MYPDSVSRRSFLRTSGAAALGLAIAPSLIAPAAAQRDLRLTAAPARVPLVGAPYRDTEVWSYGGTVPGPEIRLQQRDGLRVVVKNGLAQDTTVHWHGLRVPNAMDGVPDLTQPSIAPGASFAYEFPVPDAGTYWYHSHAHSAEQVGRGLYGALIVEEPEPPRVDRDIVWVLGDWRLTKDAAIAGGFHNPMEVGMAGRVGNTVTINGQVPDRIAVRAGERIRLRLINAAAARFFALEFRGHTPWVIANDGQPIEPHSPAGGHIVLGPAMRTDLILDMVGEPGSTASVIDDF